MSTPAKLRIPSWCVVFDGQSLNVTPTAPGGYPYLVMSGRSSSFVRPELTAVVNTGWTAGLTDTKALRINPHADSAPSTILVMLGGSLDIGAGAGGTGTNLYTVMKDYALAAKTAGYAKVICCTITPSTAFTSDQNTRRHNVNDLVIGNADGAFDLVVDLASDSSLSNPGAAHSGTTYYGSGNLSDPTSSTYYVDGLHWKAAGAQDAADSVGPALTALGAT